MTPPPKCRACGSPRVALRGRKQGEFIRQEYSFYACADCRFMAVEPFSGFAIYDAAYYRGEGPDSLVNYENEYRNWRATHRRHEFHDLARLAEDFLRQRAPAERGPVHWLDFGCGAGGLLKYLRERGRIAQRPVEITGHDVGAYAELLRDQDGFRILDFQQISAAPSDQYDVITMIEVIEHLPEPAEAIALVARLLKPGGLLLLTTGNLEAPIPRRGGIHHRYCIPEIHVSLFNPTALTRVYRAAGLEPISVRYRGAIRFKVLRALPQSGAVLRLTNLALGLPPLRWMIDAAYGVSAMPCATKPLRS